jgi:hypothetical protein
MTAYDNAGRQAISYRAATIMTLRAATFVSSSRSIATPIDDVDLVMPVSGYIRLVELLTAGASGAVVVGSCVVDLWKDSFAHWPPDVSDSICGSGKPTISSGSSYSDSTFTGWTSTQVAAGDIIRVHLESCSTFRRVSVQLKIEANNT